MPYLETETAATAAAGNIFGGYLNYMMNSNLAKQQWKQQEKMQERAYQLNEQAVQNQAQNMAHGLENAGLNPAMAGNGGGAPTVQAGSAASASSNLSQVFNGLTELIGAIKAPTEIEKTIAETQKTTAETESTITNIDKIRADAKKISEETRNIQNLNEAFESERNFLKKHTGGIFTGYIGQLKATKQWENLPTKTKMTLEDLAEGNMELDQGALNALQKIIDTQGNLSERDKQILSNTKQMIIDYNQITNKKVMDAIVKLPVRTQEKILQDIRKVKAEVNNLREQNKNLKKQRILMTKQGVKLEAEAKKIHTDREIEELNDMQYLIDHDRWEDAARLGSMRMANDLWDTGREGAKEAVGAYTNPMMKTKGIQKALKNFK